MIRTLIIFNILLVFTPSINAVYNVQTSSSGTSLKMSLNKCCPMGTNVGARKKCVKYNTTLTVSKIKIYDKDLYLTEKSFEDLFTLIPNKFENKTARINLIDITALDYNVYLTESGIVQVELPNVYDRWTEIPTDDYCIDVYNQQGAEPRYWINQPDKEETQSNSNIYLTIATMVSCVFILLVLVVYLMLPDLQNLCGMILMAYLFSLFMAFSLLIAMQLKDVSDNKACIPLASAIYFFFLAVFCWMSVMSYDMWWTFRNIPENKLFRPRRTKRCKFLIYSIYAWGVPLLMTIFLYVLNSYRNDMKHLPWFITPRIPENGCFLQGGVKLLYFYIPMLILIICNWIFYLMTAFNIYKDNAATAILDSSAAGPKQAHRDQKQRLILYLKMSVVMGLSWLLEIISFVCPGPNNRMWDIPDAYNSLIGLAMFFIFVCKKTTWNKLNKRYRKKPTNTGNLDSSQSDIALQSRVSSQPNGQNPKDDESKEKAHRRRDTDYPAPNRITSAHR